MSSRYDRRCDESHKLDLCNALCKLNRCVASCPCLSESFAGFATDARSRCVCTEDCKRCCHRICIGGSDGLVRARRNGFMEEVAVGL